MISRLILYAHVLLLLSMSSMFISLASGVIGNETALAWAHILLREFFKELLLETSDESGLSIRATSWYLCKHSLFTGGAECVENT